MRARSCAAPKIQFGYVAGKIVLGLLRSLRFVSVAQFGNPVFKGLMPPPNPPTLLIAPRLIVPKKDYNRAVVRKLAW